jgi:hypothetical protein
MSLRFASIFVLGATAVGSVVGCGSSQSGGAGGSGHTDETGNAGSGAGSAPGEITGAGASTSASADGGSPLGTIGGFAVRDAGKSGALSADSACGNLVLQPEAVQVDKTVEQKIDCTAHVPEPIALYIMLDNSKSMSDDSKWTNAVAAITSFVKTTPAPGGTWSCVDPGGESVPPPASLAPPSSGGLSVAIQYFHPLNAGASPNECDGTGHSTPAVAMGALPANGAAITASLGATSPQGKTPTVGALTGGTKYCETFEAANPGKKCVVVLVTDGQPNGCGLSSHCADGTENCVDSKSVATLTPIAKGAHDAAHGVLTFTVGMSGVSADGFALLNAIAIAGGSDCTPGTPGNEACDVTTSGTTGFLEALNKIRDSVQVTSTTNQSVTSTSTVSTTLPCEWSIPKPTDNQAFDKNHVNVTYSTGGTSRQLGNVPAATDCAATAAAGGWYYDDANAPTKIFACPATCDVLKQTVDAKVQVLIGCMTVPAMIR